MRILRHIHRGLSRNMTRYLRLVGPVLFVVILLRIDLRAVAKSLSTVAVEWIILSIASILPLFLLKTERWRAILAMQDLPYLFSSALLAVMSSFYLSLITPG